MLPRHGHRRVTEDAEARRGNDSSQATEVEFNNGGGTVTSHRGHGHYRQLVAARAKDARAAGAKYLIVDALPTSRPILERLGFVHLTDTWPCEWSP